MKNRALWFGGACALVLVGIATLLDWSATATPGLAAEDAAGTSVRKHTAPVKAGLPTAPAPAETPKASATTSAGPQAPASRP
jgi:hypothetical protein